jgi:RNA polymerase sigma-70 factor (ECF subfamily)
MIKSHFLSSTKNHAMINCDTLDGLLERIILYDDELAYASLYRHCYPSLARFAYSFIKSRELAEEIASDVLLKIWRLRQKLDHIKDFRLYLYVSTRNTALNELKKQQRLDSYSLEETGVWMKADDCTPEQLLITAEFFKKIQTAILQLPPQCRLIYKLIKEDGLKYREAAELLHLSVKTIETQMGIAMKRLYEVFQNSFREAALQPSDK